MLQSVVESVSMLTGTNLKHANSFNVRIILEMIRLHGPISRIDISKSTHLTAQTVTNITKKLLKAGLIIESSRHQDGRGAPSIMLVISPGSAYSIGVDIDDTFLSCVLVDLNGKKIECIDIELDSDGSLRLIISSIEKLIKKAEVSRNKIWGTGISYPGSLVDLESILKINSNRGESDSDWEKISILTMLENRLNCPVYFENNITAAIIGERWYGAGKDIDTFFYIFLGSVLGGGLFLNGQLFSGHSGKAGELGYLPVVNHNSAMNGMDKMSHLGRYFNLSTLFEELNANGNDVHTMKELECLHQKNNSVISDWLIKGTEHLALSILAIEHLIDPQTIFFGGRLPEAMIYEIIHLLEKIIPKHRQSNSKNIPVMRIAGAGEGSTALGAAALPLYAAFAPVPGLLMKKAEMEDNSFKQEFSSI